MTTLSARATRPGSRLLGVGAYRPERVVDNAEICLSIDSSDEWIRERSGIIERRFAGPEETVTDMSVEAAGKALAHAGVTADALDAVLVATITHPYATPAAAVDVAERLGAHGTAAYDLSAACAGFCYGVGQADALVRSGTADHVLVIGADKLSDVTDFSDRGSAFIFADGAGAVVVGPSDTARIGPTVWGTDGTQLDAITMTQSWIELRDTTTKPALIMKGQTVFRWAVREITAVVRRTLVETGLTVDDLDAFVPHQANMRITDAVVKALDLPASVVVARDVQTSGNTSSGSVPLALDRLISDGAVKSGDVALLVGFGAGMAYAAQVVVLP